MNTQFFGITYLEPADFRLSALLFGAGMALANYPETDEGNLALGNALASASRMIDGFCGKDFTPAPRTETQKFGSVPRQLKVNNFPVTQIISCIIRYSSAVTETVDVTKIVINNQQNYLEITDFNPGQLTVLPNIVGYGLNEPQIEIAYQSGQDIPPAVRVACGYQTAHLINSGFADAALPPNISKLDLDGMSFNNKKGYRPAEELAVGSLAAEARQLLEPFKQIAVA